MKNFLLLLGFIFIFSCVPPSQTKEDVKFNIDTLFAKFADVKTISYINEFEYATYDTTKRKFGKNIQYFEESNDSTGWMLNFNNKGFLNDRFHYHTVYNFSENKLYYYSHDGGFKITNFNSPPKMMPGTSEISFSLLTIIKFLKLTSKKYPERISVNDTIIEKTDYHLVCFTNPDGLPIKYKYPPMHTHTDTIYPLKLAVNKISYIPEHFFWGKTEHKLSNIVFNKKQAQKIWSKENLPTFFNKQIPKNGYTEPKVLKSGTKAPLWTAQSVTGKYYKLDDFNNNPTLFVFFSTFCGACVAEIPKLNKLAENNQNINVIGICFENNKPEIIKFTEKHKIKYKILYNAGDDVKEKYNIKGFPVNYLVNKNGYINYSVLGNIPSLEKDIQQIISQ